MKSHICHTLPGLIAETATFTSGSQLNILKMKKAAFPKVYLVGQLYNKEYYEVLISYIKDHHLENEVESNRRD
ncbi:MAG: hypothetical protein MZV64_15645 [Ignavibacteriales bacterium]|nr:hypothetical protein [Ignavibacteriales bacterium]